MKKKKQRVKNAIILSKLSGLSLKDSIRIINITINSFTKNLLVKE